MGTRDLARTRSEHSKTNTAQTVITENFAQETIVISSSICYIFSEGEIPIPMAGL